MVSQMMKDAAVAHGINPTLVRNAPSSRDKVQMEKHCRICRSRNDLTRHHLVPHSWFIREKPGLKIIRNTYSNIVPLCASCHRIVDGVRDPVGRLQKRAALRGALASNEVAFILQVKGTLWFDREYPKEP